MDEVKVDMLRVVGHKNIKLWEDCFIVWFGELPA